MIAAIVAFSCQLAIVIVVAWLAARVGRIRDPRVLLGHYQLALLMGLVTPFLVAGENGADSSAVWRAAVAASAAAAEPVVSAGAAQSTVLLLLSAGMVLRMSWLIVGAYGLRRYRRESSIAERIWPFLADLDTGTRMRPTWLVNDAIAGAATYGVRRPVVLLPRRLEALPHVTVRMIAAHELRHVQRRDFVFVVVEEIVRAVLWFHPAVWFVLDRIHLYREQAIDRDVVAAVGDSRDYAAALIDGAETSLSLRPVSTWLRARHLRARVDALINGGSMPVRTRAVAVIVLAGVLLASDLWVVRAFPVTAVAQDERVYTSADGVVLPQVVSIAKPAYTEAAMRERIEGAVRVSAVVKADGSVGDVRVVDSLDTTFGLDDQAVVATRDSRFRPGTKDGNAVAVRVEIQFTFTLK